MAVELPFRALLQERIGINPLTRVGPVSVGKDKNRYKPLALDAKCLLRAMDAVAVCRVLHPAQGDKQKINLLSVTIKLSSVTMWSKRGGAVQIGAASLFCNILKNKKQSPDFHKLGLCHVKKFL